MRGEGFAHREWRRRNVIHLEEKEKREGKMRNQLIDEAEEFKRAFYEKWKLNCETNKAYNRERKKVVILKRIMLFYIFRSPNSLALPPSALLACTCILRSPSVLHIYGVNLTFHGAVPGQPREADK